MGFAPGHYFRQALAIARFDDGAVMAASLDKNAILYGGAIWVLGQFLLILAATMQATASRPAKFNWIALVFGVVFVVILDAVLILTQYGLCHLLARWWFGARGSYKGVLRPILLGSIVTWLAAVPFVGLIIAGLWNVAVMMIVFEDVDRIGRLKAFGLSLVIGITFQAVMLGLLRPR